MRQRQLRPIQDPARITGDGDAVRQDGQEMDVGMAVTVYGTVRRPASDRPAEPSLADPDVTEH